MGGSSPQRSAQQRSEAFRLPPVSNYDVRTDPQFLAPSPSKKHFLVTAQFAANERSHFVADRSLAVRALGRAARMIFAGVKGIAALPDGFVAFFDKRIEQRNVDGSVRTTWAVSKPPKGFKPEAVKEIHVQRDGLYLSCNQRLFRCDEGVITHLLPTTEKILGASNSAYGGAIRSLALAPDRVAIAVTSKLESWHSVLVCSWDDQILGWTGAYEEVPVALSWSGDDLLVTERTGRTHRVIVPR